MRKIIVCTAHTHTMADDDGRSLSVHCVACDTMRVCFDRNLIEICSSLD